MKVRVFKSFIGNYQATDILSPMPQFIPQKVVFRIYCNEKWKKVMTIISKSSY